MPSGAQVWNDGCWLGPAPSPTYPLPRVDLALVSELPARQREVVVMRHVAGLGEAEIAEALGISRSTVSSTLRSAHDRLGHAIEEGR